MGQRCALIVDDSRTAREVLSQMLEHHHLRVETAESAEAALAFLGHHRPDVIFMDHMMPGMDGFQAVRAIKENPATATIPVMMYTSQSGEVYVGQARALGAVGVLPKQIKPVEVAEVLQSLHLLPADAVASGAVPSGALRGAGGQAGLASVEAVHAPADWSDLHSWLQEMLTEHSRTLRSDLEAGIARVIGEQLAGRPGTQPAHASPGVSFWPAGALILTLAAIAAVFFWLHLDSQAKWQAVTRQNLSLLAALESRRAVEAEQAFGVSARIADARGAVAERFAGLIGALEWGVNQSAVYPPDELPFGDARQASLAGLLARLREMGFRGTVRLESHTGDFCMMRAGDTAWELARDDLPADRCDRAGFSAEEARAQSARQSVAFANYLAELSAGRSPIRVEVEPLGNSRPRTQYPAAGSPAGDWNRAARENNRVEVRLLLEPAAALAGKPLPRP